MGQIPDLRWQSRTRGRGVVRRSSEFQVERRVKVTKLPGDSEEIMVSTILKLPPWKVRALNGDILWAGGRYACCKESWIQQLQATVKPLRATHLCVGA